MYYERLILKSAKTRGIITDQNVVGSYLAKRVCALDYADIKNVTVHTVNRMAYFILQNGAQFVVWYDIKILFSKVNFNDLFVSLLKSTPIIDKLKLEYF